MACNSVSAVHTMHYTHQPTEQGMQSRRTLPLLLLFMLVVCHTCCRAEVVMVYSVQVWVPAACLICAWQHPCLSMLSDL